MLRLGWEGTAGRGVGYWVLGSSCSLVTHLRVWVLVGSGSTGVGPPSSLPSAASHETKSGQATGGAHRDAEGAKINHRWNSQSCACYLC